VAPVDTTDAPPAAPPATASPEPAATPALAQLLQEQAAATTVDGAWSRLFALWSVQYTADAAPACAQALLQSLECLEERGGFDVLRRYNRPAILPLTDDAGALHQAVLAQLLDAERARLLVGEAAYEVPLADIQRHWDGSFQLLWKPPQLDTRNLALGAWGEPVVNLRARLNAWAGTTDDAVVDVDYFDEALQQLVMQFQAGNELVVDGIAGVRTQALLDAAVPGAGTPLLSAAR
jgi:general secretion pathway protein A